MSTDNNPFAQAGAQYSANVSFGGQTPEQPKGDLIKDTTTQRFSADVIQESRNQVVLVDFWAPWCGPCKQLTPVLEKVVTAAAGRVKLVKMNIDDHPAVAGQLGIQSIPAVIAFKDGQPVDGFMGALPEGKVREFIDKVAGPAGPGAQIEAALAAAQQALEAGDGQTAADIYQEILSVAPDNLAAIVGLAGMLVDAGEFDAARSVLDTVPADKQSDASVAGVKARIALAEQAAKLGDAGELLRRIEADPKDHQARFDLAMLHNARGERAEAADCLLAIMKADRTWNDDGARKQLLQFFEAWGMTDEATLAARRKLSALLFS
ncbi:MAG: thioredoxin [Mesorhizobium sp.]|nr:thioredoxin [Mesorhizobium sp.]